MAEKLWKFNSDVLPVEWGNQYGLVEDLGARGACGLKQLVDHREGAINNALEVVDKEADLGTTLFDHQRSFSRRGGGKRIVAIATIPYQKAVIGRFGSESAAAERIYEIAGSLNLRVRIGHPADTMYLSTYPNDPTLSIVWWNSARVHLSYPKLIDPNPGLAHRYTTDD